MCLCSLCAQVLYKPQAGRLQVVTALDGPDSENFDVLDKGGKTDEQSRVLQLQASVNTLPAAFAAAFVR